MRLNLPVTPTLFDVVILRSKGFYCHGIRQFCHPAASLRWFHRCSQEMLLRGQLGWRRRRIIERRKHVATGDRLTSYIVWESVVNIPNSPYSGVRDGAPTRKTLLCILELQTEYIGLCPYLTIYNAVQRQLISDLSNSLLQVFWHGGAMAPLALWIR